MKPPGAISAKHRSEAESRIARPPEGGTPITYYTIDIYSILKSLVFNAVCRIFEGESLPLRESQKTASLFLVFWLTPSPGATRPQAPVFLSEI